MPKPLFYLTSMSCVAFCAVAAAASSGSSVTVSINPASVYVPLGKSVRFSVLVQGTSNQQVQWSLSPQLGTMVNGVYTAPSSVSAESQVTISATSVADPSKMATATVLIGQPVTLPAPSLPAPSSPVPVVSVSPGSQVLSAGQSVQFTATVQGAGNSGVTWSLSPNVGSIVNGLYTAPAQLASQEAVTVTATSSADPAANATANLTLKPAATPVSGPQVVSISISPGSAALAASQMVAFAALVSGTSNTAVTWTFSPQVGTLANGVYTAPATISASQQVTITAASVADSSKTATATVTLTPSPTTPAPSNNNTSSATVTLPLEVIGPNGTTLSASVNIPAGSNLSGAVLWMQIHGLRYETQASVQVNNSAWMPISDSTVTLLGNAKGYGGIGGGFSTLSMTMNLPAGALQTGSNTINFRFNQTDGRVSGFRVLAFNVEAADGTMLIPASSFVNDDPNTWQPPLTDASDIAAGQTLWQSASLITPLASGGSKPILAHCSDCHAEDGRDLKYFNYSNNSIVARALFHGLTQQQGEQIASYIRSLTVANPGRPWNPPYQPGPGLDSQPAIDWAAGAGLNAVADNDQETVNAIFPSGFVDSAFAATSHLDQREIPLEVQLPDWNQWLPGTHPMDAFGSAFTSSGYNTILQTLRSNLQIQNPAAYVKQKANFDAWFTAFYSLYVQVGAPIWSSGWTPASTDAMYSLAQWGMVKTWELMNEFQLEGYAQNMFGPQADPRAWYSNLPFFVAPGVLKMNSKGTPGLRNGSAATYAYLSYIWYNVQLILNDSSGDYSYQYPIDWPYANGALEVIANDVPPKAGIQSLWMIKALQVLQQNGKGPQFAGDGWEPNAAQLSLLVTLEWNSGVWGGVDPSTRAAIATGIVKSWLASATQFTPQQFYAGGWTTANARPVPGGSATDTVFVDWIWYTIPRLAFIGTDPTVVANLAQWAQTMWPSANWTADLHATCSWANNVPNGVINCSQ